MGPCECELGVGGIGDMFLVAKFTAAKDLVDAQGVKGGTALNWSRSSGWGNERQIIRIMMDEREILRYELCGSSSS